MSDLKLFIVGGFISILLVSLVDAALKVEQIKKDKINFLKEPPKDLIGWVTEPKPDNKWGKDYMFTFTTPQDCTFSQEGSDFKTYLVKCELKGK